MRLIFSFLFLAFISSGCKKSPQDLPSETQTGTNALGCKINGTIYTPHSSFGCSAYRVEYYQGLGALYIRTNNGCDMGLNLTVYDVFEQKDYSIFNPAVNAFTYSTKNANCSWYDRNNATQSGTVTITKLDIPNKIVAGKFNGIIKKEGCPDINITEGRFDFKMSIYN